MQRIGIICKPLADFGTRVHTLLEWIRAQGKELLLEEAAAGRPWCGGTLRSQVRSLSESSPDPPVTPCFRVVRHGLFDRAPLWDRCDL